jgi:hypothetical protein
MCTTGAAQDSVECDNAYMNNHNGTVRRGTTVRASGLTSHLLVLALKVAGVNIRIIDTHRELHSRSAAPSLDCPTCGATKRSDHPDQQLPLRSPHRW